MNARPKKDESERRKRQMNFLCTEEERNEIETLAAIHGYKNVAEYVRRVALGYESANRDELKNK